MISESIENDISSQSQGVEATQSNCLGKKEVLSSAKDSYDSSDDENDETIDPITMEVMRDPVMTIEGFTYDRSSIEAWFSRRGNAVI